MGKLKKFGMLRKKMRRARVSPIENPLPRPIRERFVDLVEGYEGTGRDPEADLNKLIDEYRGTAYHVRAVLLANILLHRFREKDLARRKPVIAARQKAEAEAEVRSKRAPRTVRARVARG